jgi:glycosyltransferase involved in cell wall biosynthesis
MALDLPIVASDIPSIREAVGDAAFALVPRDRPDLLAAALANALEGGPKAAACVRNGRARFAKMFDIESVAVEMAQMYHAILRPPSREDSAVMSNSAAATGDHAQAPATPHLLPAIGSRQ